MFFSYDPNGSGFRFHETEEEAKKEANDAFEYENGCAHDDGWSDEATDICWGKVLERVQIIEESRQKKRKGNFDETYNCELKKV
jgi:hypothetical protein